MPDSSESNKLYKELNISVYWKNRDGVYIGCNDVAAKNVGMIPADLIGQTDSLLFSEEIASEYKKNDEKIIKSGETYVFEEGLVNKATPDVCGEKYSISSKSPFINDKGEIDGIIGVTIDITRIKKLESELRTSNQKLSDLLAKISATQRQFLENQEHDTRTPLSGIVSAADALRALTDDEVMLMYINYVKRSGDELNAYNEELLAALYEGEGYHRYSPRRFDLYALIERVFNFNYASANMKSLEYQYTIDRSQISQYAISDRQLIYRCLLNLIGNAIQFTETGFVHLTVSLFNEDAKYIYVEFKVTDSGIGIPENKQDEIFERFTKLAPSNKGGERHRGLGLTLTRNAVDALDGELHLSSQLSKGSEFRMLVPLQKTIDQKTPA